MLFLHFKQTDQYFYPPITFWLPEILTPSNHQWRQIRSIFLPICYSPLTLWSWRCSKYQLVLLEKTWMIQNHGLGLEKEKERNWNEMRAEKWKTKQNPGLCNPQHVFKGIKHWSLQTNVIMVTPRVKHGIRQHLSQLCLPLPFNFVTISQLQCFDLIC